MNPLHPLQAQSPDDSRLWYATISGTSMSSPVTAGIATLVVDAYRQNNDGSPAPAEVLNTVEATADEARNEYAPSNMGTGFVDALDAVTRAENGDMADYGDVTLPE